MAIGYQEIYKRPPFDDSSVDAKIDSLFGLFRLIIAIETKQFVTNLNGLYLTFMYAVG